MPQNALAPPIQNMLYRVNQAQEMDGLTMPQRYMYQLYRSKPQLAQTPITFQKPNEQMINGAGLESWPIGEEGSSDIRRPMSLPISRGGIQMNPERLTSAKDVVADWAGHIANNPDEPAFDPKLADIYSRFVQSLDPKLLKKRYEYDVANGGETRPFATWANSSGIPALFRGYTFNQWPNEFNNKVFSPEQKRIMDEARSHLGMR
jgi:hypothetical protein